MTFICILIVGICNIRSYYILGNLSIKHKKYNYEQLCRKILGQKFLIITYLLSLTLNIYTFCLIIIHQVFIYRLLGGIINIIGRYNYESPLDFLSNSFWKHIWVKLCVNFVFAIFVIFPLFYLRDMKKLNILSTIEAFTTLFILFVILFQFPFYFNDFLSKKNLQENKNTNINFINLSNGFTKQVHFLQAFSLLFFCFTGDRSLLPTLNHFERPTPIRNPKIYYKALSIDMIIYLFISIIGYLAAPNDIVDIFIERKKIWSIDLIMNIGRILLIFISISKIQIYYNIWRESFFSCINYSQKKSLIFAIITILLTTILSSVYQNIVGYISLIGGFCIVFPSFLVPSILYMLDNNIQKSNWKVVLQMIFGVALCIVGFISGILGLIDIINGEK